MSFQFVLATIASTPSILDALSVPGVQLCGGILAFLLFLLFSVNPRTGGGGGFDFPGAVLGAIVGAAIGGAGVFWLKTGSLVGAAVTVVGIIVAAYRLWDTRR